MTFLAENDLDRIIEDMERSAKTTPKYIERFQDSVDTIMGLFKDSPYIGKGLRSGDDNVRYRSIPNYDWAIYYDVNDDELDVLAFALIPERAGQQTIDGLLNERINLLSVEKKD
jgi:hypothetical protein